MKELFISGYFNKDWHLLSDYIIVDVFGYVNTRKLFPMNLTFSTLTKF